MTILISGGGSGGLSAGSVSAQYLANSSVGQALGMLNGTLVASVATNILTIAIKTLAGADPSSTDPVFFLFRNATIATGDYAVVQLTSALSINTNATGATLGTANTVPFRLWVNVFNNAGTPVLALWQSVTGGASPTAIAPLNEAAVASTTAISGTATSAGTFYTPNGTTITSKAFRILGYVDYASGLTTAGTYASTPTTIQLFGPGIKKPSEVIQTVYSTSTTSTTVASTTKTATNTTASITPTAAPNLIFAEANGTMLSGSASAAAAQISRGSTPTLFGSKGGLNAVIESMLAMNGLDAPGTTSATSYTVYIWNSTGTGTTQWIGTLNSEVQQSVMRLQEIMV